MQPDAVTAGIRSCGRARDDAFEVQTCQAAIRADAANGTGELSICSYDALERVDKGA